MKRKNGEPLRVLPHSRMENQYNGKIEREKKEKVEYGEMPASGGESGRSDDPAPWSEVSRGHELLAPAWSSAAGTCPSHHHPQVVTATVMTEAEIQRPDIQPQRGQRPSHFGPEGTLSGWQFLLRSRILQFAWRLCFFLCQPHFPHLPLSDMNPRTPQCEPDGV